MTVFVIFKQVYKGEPIAYKGFHYEHSSLDRNSNAAPIVSKQGTTAVLALLSLTWFYSWTMLCTSESLIELLMLHGVQFFFNCLTTAVIKCDFNLVA